MKKIFLILSFMACSGTHGYCQNDTGMVRVEPIDKRIGGFEDKFNLGTPLNSYLTFSYILADGRRGLLKSVITYRNQSDMPDPATPDKPLGEQQRKKLLDRKIVEMRYYGDSVAAVILEYDELPTHIIGWLTYEDGQWMNAGEDLGNSLEDARMRADQKSEQIAGYVRRIVQLKQTSSDPAAFISYLKANGQPPKDYLLEKLKNHKLVICGELHRRKVSWDLMKDLIRDPEFAENAGTVFVELPSWKQGVFDRFYNSKTMYPELILDIMRAEQVYGWWDRGEYEFLIELWKVNQNLPAINRIRVVAVDEQAPWDRLQTKEDVNSYMKVQKDRNGHMADIIESHLKNSSDKRSNLFIVGYAHAEKSQWHGIASAIRGKVAQPTAGRQLTDRFSESEVFIVFPHTMIMNNASGSKGPLRNGLFDEIFAIDGNSTGFDLKNSPFGREPYDASDPGRFNMRSGSYEQNFDGYIFFGPLDNEGPEYHVYDIFTDEFVGEIKRRAYIMEWENEKFFEIQVKELTKENIISQLRKTSERTNRW